MSDTLEVDKPLIEPIYSQSKPNQPIDLGHVAVQFKNKDTEYHEMARVTMRFQPDNRLQFIFPLEGKDISFVNNFIINSAGDLKIALDERNISFDAFRVSTDVEIVFLPKKSVITVTQPSDAISTATFHLFNFPNFWGPEDYILRTIEPSSEQRCGRVVLKADGWEITISATDRTYDFEKELKAQGGYALMHMGQIVREDGTTFTSEQLDDLLICMQYFLSFVLGRWEGIATNWIR